MPALPHLAERLEVPHPHEDHGMPGRAVHLSNGRSVHPQGMPGRAVNTKACQDGVFSVGNEIYRDKWYDPDQYHGFQDGGGNEPHGYKWHDSVQHHGVGSETHGDKKYDAPRQ